MKAIWVPVIFLAGLGAGVLLERGRDHETPAGAKTLVLTAAPSSVAGIRTERAPVIATSPSIGTHAAAAPASPGATPIAREAVSEANAAADEPAPSQPIDVGAVFRTQFDINRKQGFHDQTGELHAALEREARDDSWSYPLEADIQNSLLADTSAGNFKTEHVECRASMCEVRLSAAGDQQAKALQKWTEGIHTQTWGSQINLNSMLTISDGGHTDTLMILAKPPKAGPSR